MSADIRHGDCLEVLAAMPDSSVDAVVCDPPYGLEFMGKEWDSFRTDDPGTRRHRGERAGAQGTTGSTDERWTGADGRSMPSRRVGYGGGKRPTTNQCATCGKRDQFRNSHDCPDPQWQSVILNPHAAPPTSLAFGKWCELWTAECLRVLKPGGHLLAFGGTRTWHRLACAVEDAGFEMRDSIAWLYGSGFPKSHDVSKAIDKAAGAEREVIGQHASPAGNKPGGASLNMSVVGMPKMADITAPATDAARQWAGFGTALKPAFEPVVVARKPLVGTVAQNVLAYGTGALNIDATRIGYASESDRNAARVPMADFGPGAGSNDLPAYRARGRRGDIFEPPAAGRWPANVVLDEDQAAALDQQSGITTSPTSTGRGASAKRTSMAGALGAQGKVPAPGDAGGASRFFYVAKAPKSERPVVDGIAHPTVKPLALMRWLVRLVTPPSGIVLDPFAGSGTTVEAAILEGFDVIGIEREADYLPLIHARIERASGPRCQWRTTEQCTYRQGHEGPCSMPFVEPESEAEEVAKVVSDVWDLFS